MNPAARSRIPLAIGALTVFGGGLWWQTAGSRQQPKSITEPNGTRGKDQTLQQMAGTGGRSARGRDETTQSADPKNTRIMSSAPDVHSKRNPDKDRSTSQGDVLSQPRGE
ncbi:hypothetical protein MAPG_05060 [Magnaporthiopsis poae ATCC 64411]|uniref:Uncharacterized protein n=1 Tax=Magnaporthiopsis poae (strain ATCC 64411 / 73-15) TaxID=644358 RepID=A0A0C4DYD9_MAGP6|nr:hypothetical protein MAPG_05060 [Magnaporthiopsis poae ATCC 64411]